MTGLFSGFLASIVVRGIGALAALAVNVWFARLLGVVEYGRYMALLSLALVLGGLATRGVDQLFTRDMATTAFPESYGSLGLIRWGAMRVLLGVVLATAVFVGWVAWSRRADTLSTLLPTLSGGVLVIALFSSVTVLGGAINGLGASLRSQSLALVIQNGAILFLIGVTVALTGQVTSADSALWIQVGAYLVATTIGVSWLYHILKWRRLAACKGAPLKAAEGSKEWGRSANHYLWMTIAALLVSRVDVVLIAMLAGDATAGVYAVGARLAQVALMVPLAVNVVLSPRIATAWRQGEHSVVRALVRRGLMFTVPLAILEVVTAIVFGRDLVALFGTQYFAATTPFVWVTLAYALWTVVAPGYALLAMSGSEQTVAILSWGILIANVAAILLLVPRYGATGGAVAMTVGYGLVIPVVLAVIGRKYEIFRGVSRDQ